MNNYFQEKHKGEPWQIAAARFCVDNAEKGFIYDQLEGYIRSLYTVEEKYIKQFWDEEIDKPAGREYSRNVGHALWMPPLDLVSKVTDYDELKEARKNAKLAFWFSIVAIIISLLTLYSALILGEKQLTTSQEQIRLQNNIWEYEKMRDSKLEERDIQWRKEDLRL